MSSIKRDDVTRDHVTVPAQVELIILARRDVAALLPPISQQLSLVKQTYLEMARGRVELPPKPGIHPRRGAFIHAMPAYLIDHDIAAIKWVSGYPTNRDRCLPYISGIIVVNDPETGVPIAVMDAAEITAARTAAASGVCIRNFAPRGWQRAAILGCGEQGHYHARVLTELNPAATIHAYDPEPGQAASLEGRVEIARSANAAVDGAEVVITAGPMVENSQPMISSKWLAPRHLLLPIDFDFYIQPGAIDAVDLFAVDDVDQFYYYQQRGHFKAWREPDASMGDALAGGEDHQRVACVNLGVGALDAAFAASVCETATEKGIGLKFRL